MYKNISLVLIFFFLFAYKAFCGSTPHTFLIKASPLELLNNITNESTTLQLSYEQHLTGHYSINQDVGYIFHGNIKSSFFTIILDKVSGFSLETELRRYFPKAKHNQCGKYLALGLMYRYLEARDHQSLFDSTSAVKPWTAYYSNEDYSIFRNEVGFHLKIGYQKISNSNFLYDASIGLGWRRIMSRSNNQYPLGDIAYEVPYNKPFAKGSKSFFSITLAFRIGLAF